MFMIEIMVDATNESGMKGFSLFQSGLGLYADFSEKRLKGVAGIVNFREI